MKIENHTQFRDVVKLMRDAWAELKLRGYEFIYESTYSYGVRLRYSLVCPEALASRAMHQRHLKRPAVRVLMYNNWLALREYFNNLSLASQKYLIRKHKMVKYNE